MNQDEKREAMERILGGKIEERGKRSIPGVDLVEGTEFAYYEDDRKLNAKKQFRALLDAAGTITATSGGVTSDMGTPHDIADEYIWSSGVEAHVRRHTRECDDVRDGVGRVQGAVPGSGGVCAVSTEPCPSIAALNRRMALS